MLAERAPLLQRAAREFAAPAIRNMATMGGNLCTASPAGDCLPPLYALGAQVELVSLAGRRRLPIADFVVAPGRTALTQGEVVARVLLPAREYFAWQSYEKVGRRRSLAITVVSFAGLLRIDDAQRVAAAHFAWGAVAPTVVCAPEVAAVLTGRTLEPALIEQAVERALRWLRSTTCAPAPTTAARSPAICCAASCCGRCLPRCHRILWKKY